MLLDRLTESLPQWLAAPLSFLTALAALAGAGCLFAAAAYGSYSWGLRGGGVSALAGLLWNVADRLAVRRYSTSSARVRSVVRS